VVHLAVVIYAAAFVEEVVDADRWVYCCFYPELILSLKYHNIWCFKDRI
jgi:hypothetical protein